MKYSVLCGVPLFPAIRANIGTVKSFLVQLLVKNIQLEDGKMIPASKFFGGEDNDTLELTEAELVTREAVRVRDHFKATVWLSRSCTAHVFCESHSLESGCAHFLLMYVLALARHSVGSILSCGFICSLAPSPSTTGSLGFGQLGLTLLGIHCQQ